MSDQVRHIRKRCHACRTDLHMSCWDRLADTTDIGTPVGCACGCWDGQRTSLAAVEAFVRRYPFEAALKIVLSESGVFVCRG